MRFLLLLIAWATAVFLPSWLLSVPYQHAIGAAAGHFAAPPGTSIEFMELELFYPFDLGIFVALCLASDWASFPRRLKAIAIGLPVLVVLEIAALTTAMVLLLPIASSAAEPTGAASAERFALGLIRATGLMAGASAWFVLLGRERLSLAGGRWLEAGRR